MVQRGFSNIPSDLKSMPGLQDMANLISRRNRGELAPGELQKQVAAINASIKAQYPHGRGGSGSRAATSPMGNIGGGGSYRPGQADPYGQPTMKAPLPTPQSESPYRFGNYGAPVNYMENIGGGGAYQSPSFRFGSYGLPMGNQMENIGGGGAYTPFQLDPRGNLSSGMARNPSYMLRLDPNAARDWESGEYGDVNFFPGQGPDQPYSVPDVRRAAMLGLDPNAARPPVDPRGGSSFGRGVDFGALGRSILNAPRPLGARRPEAEEPVVGVPDVAQRPATGTYLGVSGRSPAAAHPLGMSAAQARQQVTPPWTEASLQTLQPAMTQIMAGGGIPDLGFISQLPDTATQTQALNMVLEALTERGRIEEQELAETADLAERRREAMLAGETVRAGLDLSDIQGRAQAEAELAGREERALATRRQEEIEQAGVWSRALQDRAQTEEERVGLAGTRGDVARRMEEQRQFNIANTFRERQQREVELAGAAERTQATTAHQANVEQAANELQLARDRLEQAGTEATAELKQRATEAENRHEVALEQQEIARQQITSDEELARERMTMQEDMQQAEITAQADLQAASLTSQADIAEAQRDLQRNVEEGRISQQEADRALQRETMIADESIRIQEIQSREGTSAAERELALTLDGLRAETAAKDRDLRVTLQETDIARADRERISGEFIALENLKEQKFDRQVRETLGLAEVAEAGEQRASRERIALNEDALQRELAVIGISDREAERLLTSQMAMEERALQREQMTSRERQALLEAQTALAIANLQNPYAAAVQQMGLGGVMAGLQPLGFQGQTPGGGFFPAGTPTIGALAQTDPESLNFLNAVLAGAGITPEQFGRQAGAVTPIAGLPDLGGIGMASRAFGARA